MRERAFFSSTIEDVRWLQARQNFLQDVLAQTTAVNDDGERYFVAGGRAKFIEEAQADAIAAGLGPLDPNDVGTIKDITSAGRLALIYDTNLQAAQDYGNWKQGQDPDVLDSFPAQRFIRVQAVKKPRPLHQANRNEVRRKDDLKFWLAMNTPAIGGFGVPWGPWGFNSGMGVEDVDREESDAAGLTKPNETIKPVVKQLNDQLQASTQNLDQRLINFLKAAFGDQVRFTEGGVQWAPSAPELPENNEPKPPEINEPAAAPNDKIPEDEETTSATGVPVSEAATVDADNKAEAAKFQAALDAIDQVHGDGDLEPIPFQNKTDPRYLAAYMSRSDLAVGIFVRPALADTQFTLAHEVGHWLDHIGIESASKFASEGAPIMSDWLNAVRKTDAYRQILADKTTSPAYRDYLLSPRELWARSYAQFIADESGDGSMLASVDRVLSGNFGKMPAFTQWQEKDFAPVRSAIAALFVKLGWMQAP